LPAEGFDRRMAGLSWVGKGAPSHGNARPATITAQLAANCLAARPEATFLVQFGVRVFDWGTASIIDDGRPPNVVWLRRWLAYRAAQVRIRPCGPRASPARVRWRVGVVR
jgi:hypothetical protein